MGHVLKNPETAAMLRAVAAQGARALHEGPVAAAIVAKVRGHTGNPGAPSMMAAQPGIPGPLRASFAPMQSMVEYGTSHIGIVDADDHALAMTTTIEDAFGSRQMVTTDASRPGGALIIHHTAKTLYGALQWDLTPQQAIDLPNFGSVNGPTLLEEGRFTAAVQALRAYGAEVREMPTTSGLQALRRRTGGGWLGGADPRREGIAMTDCTEAETRRSPLSPAERRRARRWARRCRAHAAAVRPARQSVRHDAHTAPHPS